MVSPPRKPGVEPEGGLKYNWHKMAHFLSEAFAAHDFKGGELRILQIICRETYGRTISREDPRKKEFCALRQEYLAHIIGLPEPSIRRFISGLVKNQVLLRLPPKGPNSPWQLGINTKIADWGVKLQGVIREREYPRRWEGREDQPVTGGSPDDGGDHSGSPIPSMGDHSVTGGGSQRDGGIKRNPNDTNGLPLPKESLNKEPPSMTVGNRVSGHPPDQPRPPDDAKAMALDMFRNFRDNWWPLNSPPRSLLSECQEFTERWDCDLETIWSAFDDALTDTLNWQDRESKEVSRPGSNVLNKAAKILMKRGLKLMPRARPTVPILSDDDDDYFR